MQVVASLQTMSPQKMSPPSAVATTPSITRTRMLIPSVVKLCAAKRDKRPHDRTAEVAD